MFDIVMASIITLIICALISMWIILDMRAKHLESIERAKKDSVQKSKTVIRAFATESIVPVLDGFPYCISDLQLFGQPLDYAVFDGMTEFRDGNKEKEITIVFADVKTGNAKKNPVQNAIVKAIQNGRVRFEEWRIDENNKLTIK